MEQWSWSEEPQEPQAGWSAAMSSTSEGRHEPRRRVWMGAALAAARKFIEVPVASPKSWARPDGCPGDAGWSSWDSWSRPREWPSSWDSSRSWSQLSGRQWEYFADLRGQDAKSEWTDWRGRGEGQWNDWRPMERAAPAEPSRTFEASDPFIDLSLTSLAQLVQEPQSAELEQATQRLAQQLRSPDVRLSRQQLLRCLELLRFGNTTLAVAVAPRAARAVHTLAPAELVQAAQSLAAAPPTSAALESLGVVLGEAICRHRCLDLDQLSTLTAEASGSVLKSLLRHVEVDELPDESEEDEEVLVACLDRLADQAPRLSAEDLVASLCGLAMLGVRDDVATAALSEEVTQAIPMLACPELALLSWACGTLGLRSVPTMEAIAEESLRRIWQFGANDLIKLLCGFGSLGLRHRPFLEAVASAIDWSLQQLPLRGLVQAAWFLAVLASPEHKVMTSIANQMLMQLEHLSLAELAGVWVLSDLVFDMEG
ncbi:unnamed protein product [Durusdinium trenchii]|uniref:Uncharacterized protein n=1 Tax=Durusdinium trenchii TaxID=1381693 RepID=A0ABP0SGK5_9DINO